MTKYKIITWALLGLLLAGLLAGCTMSGATTTSGSSGDTSSSSTSWFPILFLVVILVLMYALMFIPQRRRQKQQQQMVSDLKRGDEVITNGGVYGIIEVVDQNSFVIKLEGGTTMRIIKSSVAGKRPEDTR